MEGWRPVEDLVRWGFGHAPVVMANEAYSGLAQPEMRRMVGTALDLAWTLWPDEAVIEVTPDTDRNYLRSREFTNWREREQAANLCRLLEAAAILRDQAPPPLAGWDGLDAFVVSTDNRLTEDPVTEDEA